MVYIGIDLGTTYSCVSVMENGEPKAIHHDDGRNTIPSVVAYGDNETLVGTPALAINTDMTNILYDSKRLIGWEFLSNLPIADNRQLWTFHIDTRNKCAGYVLKKGQPNERFLKPEEVSAEILKYLKDRAEVYLNQRVTGVVVTIPAFFNDKQQEATRKAAELAELELKEMLHEPNAAAIAYNEKYKLGNSILLVFDFGGGTLDVSILWVNGINVEVKAVVGEQHLGGQDFDARIMRYAIEEYKKISNYDIYQNKRLIKRLRAKCREAKEALSNRVEAVNINLEISSGDLNVSLDKSTLSTICKDLLDKAMFQVDLALNTSQLSVNDIHYVLLVGGSTRIPKIRELLTNKFGKEKLKNDLNPDEIVAYGAAIVANIKERAQILENVRITPNNNREPSNDIRKIDSSEMVYIGIDLGTTYSCVSVVENGKPRIIFNEEGKDFTPSIVSYGDNSDILVGNHALNYPDLSRVLYDSKRLLGWEFMYDLPIAENRLLWEFDLDTRNESVGYVLNRGTAEERFILPEEVSADILRNLKRIAETYMGKSVTGAVVAIPAFFQTAQIEATKRAIEMAGLELKMLVKEPIAAAIAYNEDRELEDSNIMIFDFGGGTLNINICKIENGRLTIKAVCGDKHLGGQDFDGIIMNYVIQEYMRTSTYDILGNKRLVKRLRAECRRAKEALSFTPTQYTIHLDIDLDYGSDLDVQLTKEKLNELCEELYIRTSKLIDDTLRMAKLRTDDIDHVILAGGSTRIPAIRNILEMKLGNEKLKFNISPDKTVVFGAAILADAIEKEKQIPLI